MHAYGHFSQQRTTYTTVDPYDYNEAEKLLSPSDIIVANLTSQHNALCVYDDAGVNKPPALPGGLKYSPCDYNSEG